MKIIHIVENIRNYYFHKIASKSFEAVFPGQNEYITFGKKNKIEKQESFEVRHYKKWVLLYPWIVRKILKADVVVFHGLPNNGGILSALKALDSSTKTIWIGWGYDYYDLIPRKLLKEKTEKLIKRKNAKDLFLNFKVILKKIVFRLLNIDKTKLINKIDVFSPVLYEDYLLVKESVKNFKPKYMAWNYANIDDNILRKDEKKRVDGLNILVGNSASNTNNHLEAFELLSNINLDNRKVIVPLSYGDELYKEQIVQNGQEIFGDKFYPLLDFMPVEEYKDVLQSCSIVIMNHLRQQALGNINIALLKGAKVFLDEQNPVYQFYKKQGVFIYKLDELIEQYQTMHTDKEIEHNQQVLNRNRSAAMVLKKTKLLVEAALES